jgi:hypothetical protein
MFRKAALLLFLSTTISTAEDRPRDKSQLVVMTLNAEFLWDGLPPDEGQPDFPWKGSPTEAEHMAAVAQVITRENPDIVNLVEVENLAASAPFTDCYLVGYGYAQYFVQGRDTYTGQDVVLLTRIARRTARSGTA